MILNANKVNCILLVDDDEVTNFINERLIGRMGIVDHVHTSRHGKDALNFIAENCKENGSKTTICPQLILLDINMPVMDGFQFLQEIQQHDTINKDLLKIVILTSSEDERDVKKAKQFNVEKVLCKPLTEQMLKELMND